MATARAMPYALRFSLATRALSCYTQPCPLHRRTLQGFQTMRATYMDFVLQCSQHAQGRGQAAQPRGPGFARPPGGHARQPAAGH